MFDENFSFVSSTSNTTSHTLNDCASAEISPFTSRCSSPGPNRDASLSVSSQPYAHRDSRYNSYYAPRHPSITALTAQLQSHALSGEPAEVASPTDSTFGSENDDSIFDGIETPSSTSDYSDFDPSLYDLSMAELHPTSSPRPSLSLEAQAASSFSQRRRQRQAMVRLQTLVRKAPDLAMLIEECHPCNLPLGSDVMWASRSRASRSSSTSSSRIEKDRWVGIRRAPRLRKRTTT